MLVFVIALLAGSGCVNDTKSGSVDSESMKNVKLQIAGSTTVLPIAEECARVFMEKHPGSRIFVSSGGSSYGIKSVADGTVDIGCASRDLKSTEKDAHPDLVMHGVAKDGVAVTVHPSNPATDLTMEQLQDTSTQVRSRTGRVWEAQIPRSWWSHVKRAPGHGTASSRQL